MLSNDVFMDDAYLRIEWLPLVFIAAWLFVLGAAVGSFLNVVVYRLPRRASLVYPGSACPKCGRAIRWHDNIPVVGWLRLGGRCRDCREPISIRYPLVEATVALVFVLIAIPDLLWREWQWLLYARHILLMCLLACAALMEFDQQSPPLRLLVGAAILGIVIPAAPLAIDEGFVAVMAHWLRLAREQLLQLGVAAFIGVIGLPFFGQPPWAFPLAAVAICELAAVGALDSWNVASLAGAVAAILIATKRLTSRNPMARRSGSNQLIGWAQPLFPAVLMLIVIRPVAAQVWPAIWLPRMPPALVGAGVVALAAIVVFVIDRSATWHSK